MTSLRVVFSGATGRMGRALLPGLRTAPDLEIVGALGEGDDLVKQLATTRPDVVIDFTAPGVAVPHAEAIVAAGAHGVIGTTGFTQDDLVSLDARAREAERALAIVPNFSLGMVLLQRFAEEAARHFPRVEILETHHEGKVDAPSGTALDTARRIARVGSRPGPEGGEARGLDVDGVRVHSLRLAGIQARQEVHFGAPAEGLVLRHDAFSRACYLEGVLLAVRHIAGHVGLVHGLDPFLPRRDQG